MVGKLCALCASLVLGSAPLFAQTTTGTLRGIVTDTSGAVLPGVTVELTGAAGTQTAASDANGQYRFQALTPGVYALKASLDGFKVMVMAGLQVEVGRTFDVDLRLEVGAMAETVGGAYIVTAGGNAGESATGALAITVGGAFIGNAPSIEIEAADEISIRVGGASLKMTDGSVEIKAPSLASPGVFSTLVTLLLVVGIVRRQRAPVAAMA